MPEVFTVWVHNLQPVYKGSLYETVSKMVDLARSNTQIDYLLTRARQAKVAYVGENVFYFDEQMKKASLDRSLWGRNYQVWQIRESLKISDPSPILLDSQAKAREIIEGTWVIYGASKELRAQRSTALSLQLPDGTFRLITRINDEANVFTSV